MDSSTLRKINTTISSAKDKCDSMLKDERAKKSDAKLKDFLKGSKIGLDFCSNCVCLEEYERELIRVASVEKSILEDIKNFVLLNSLKSKVIIDAKHLAILNIIRGIRCSIECVYKFLLNELGEK